MGTHQPTLCWRNRSLTCSRSIHNYADLGSVASPRQRSAHRSRGLQELGLVERNGPLTGCWRTSGRIGSCNLKNWVFSGGSFRARPSVSKPASRSSESCCCQVESPGDPREKRHLRRSMFAICPGQEFEPGEIAGRDRRGHLLRNLLVDERIPHLS